LKIPDGGVDLGESDLHFFSLATRLRTDRPSGRKEAPSGADNPNSSRGGYPPLRFCKIR
jgi:hypothetical protein